jgi:hypothetical protein
VKPKAFCDHPDVLEKWGVDRWGIAVTRILACGYLAIQQIQTDTEDLARHPAGTHLGQLKTLGDAFHSEMWIPERWITRYTHDFCYKMSRQAKLRAAELLKQRKFSITCFADAVLLDGMLREGWIWLEEIDDQDGPIEAWTAFANEAAARKAVCQAFGGGDPTLLHALIDFAHDLCVPTVPDPHQDNLAWIDNWFSPL